MEIFQELFPNNDFIFIQDGAPSRSAKKVQNILRERMNSCFVKNVDWPRTPLIVILWITYFGIRFNKTCIKTIIANLSRV